MTPGTCARIWLLMPVLLTTGCATSVPQAEEGRGPRPRGEVTADCMREAASFLVAGPIGSLIALPYAAICIPKATVTVSANKTAPQSATVPGTTNELPFPSASVGNSYDKTEVRKLTDKEATVFPRNSYPDPSSYDKTEVRKLTVKEASVFPAGYYGCGYANKSRGWC